jgi:hypothetical protein
MMSKSSNIGEVAARMLSELEEAGAENFTSTVNTIMDRSGKERELADSVEALEELIRAGLAVLRHEGTQDLPAHTSIALLPQLASDVSFDPEDSLWKSDENLPMVEIVATEKGRDLAFEILDERGYQWWRQKDTAEGA